MGDRISFSRFSRVLSLLFATRATTSKSKQLSSSSDDPIRIPFAYIPFTPPCRCSPRVVAVQRYSHDSDAASSFSIMSYCSTELPPHSFPRLSLVCDHWKTRIVRLGDPVISTLFLSQVLSTNAPRVWHDLSTFLTHRLPYLEWANVNPPQ